MDFMAAQTAWPDAGLSVWLDAGLDPWLERRIEAASFSTVILPEVENPISETLPDLLSNPDAKFNNPFPRFQEQIARSVFRLKVISFSALTMCRKNKKLIAGVAASSAVQHRTPGSQYEVCWQ